MTYRLYRSGNGNSIRDILEHFLLRNQNETQSIDVLLEQPIDFSSRISEEDYLEAGHIGIRPVGLSRTVSKVMVYSNIPKNFVAIRVFVCTVNFSLISV